MLTHAGHSSLGLAGNSGLYRSTKNLTGCFSTEGHDPGPTTGQDSHHSSSLLVRGEQRLLRLQRLQSLVNDSNQAIKVLIQSVVVSLRVCVL